MCVCGVFVLLTLLCVSVSAQFFHEASRVVLRASVPADYFGYSVLLRNSQPPQLVVGAPRSMSTHDAHEGLGPTGAVFSCLLENLPTRGSNQTCEPLNFDVEGNVIAKVNSMTIKHYKDEMWLGGALAGVENGSLVMCAPRWANQIMERHRLINGACYVMAPYNVQVRVPLMDLGRQAFMSDGTRDSYGKAGTHLNLYAYGQAGVSATVTPDQRWLLLGAPGLLQWTGGVVQYKIFRDRLGHDLLGKQPTPNPYFTTKLEQDSYFGYSVDAGVFEKGGEMLCVAGGPRALSGFGQVIVFELGTSESMPLRIRGSVRGAQLGGYFGAAVCASDVNHDGRADLLVGAPTHAARDSSLPYDQGAVFLYLTRPKISGFEFELVATLYGSADSGARFGSSIADLGDLDADGFPEIAVGAPWESEGRGAVYIYRGAPTGVHPSYVQRLFPPDSRGFGISIARGLDVDDNGCNDIAVGAYDSATAMIFRSVPTLKVKAFIKVPDAVDLPQNATNFTALFCVIVASTSKWPMARMDLAASPSADVGDSRAVLLDDEEYVIHAAPNNEMCEEKLVVVHPHADLSRPISLTLDLKMASNPFNDKQFNPNSARLSDQSDLHSTLEVQLSRDCGEDLICQPEFKLYVTSLSSDLYIPGSGEKLGAAVRVKNLGEPAYGACIITTLPISPLRVPSECRLQEMNLTCELPRPLHRGQEVSWNIELEYAQVTTGKHDLILKTELLNTCSKRDVSDITQALLLSVEPQADITVEGQALPNISNPITRNVFEKGDTVAVTHVFDIVNTGPSDWPFLIVDFWIIPSEAELTSSIDGCENKIDGLSRQLHCSWSTPANSRRSVLLQLRVNMKTHSETMLDAGAMNVTTIAKYKTYVHDYSLQVRSELVLDPAPPMWPMPVGLLAGLLLLAVIVYALYKRGFFWRAKREQMRRLQEDDAASIGTVPMQDTEPPSSPHSQIFDSITFAGTSSFHEHLLDTDIPVPTESGSKDFLLDNELAIGMVNPPLNVFNDTDVFDTVVDVSKEQEY